MFLWSPRVEDTRGIKSGSGLRIHHDSQAGLAGMSQWFRADHCRQVLAVATAIIPAQMTRTDLDRSKRMGHLAEM